MNPTNDNHPQFPTFTNCTFNVHVNTTATPPPTPAKGRTHHPVIASLMSGAGLVSLAAHLGVFAHLHL